MLVLIGIGLLGKLIDWLFGRNPPPRPANRSAGHSRPAPPTVPPVREGYGPGWTVLSRQVRQRDNWACSACGWKAVGRDRYYLHAHHVVVRGRGGSDTPDNLVSLCLECHARQPGHRHLRRSPVYQRFMNHRYGHG
ncbi:MAG: HNH endonuclease [Caldilineaceae bacterium SB0661_bin_34]|nr:HNH endonuclease [Caldilineaceae bacterium SB0661_bin_34]